MKLYKRSPHRVRFKIGMTIGAGKDPFGERGWLNRKLFITNTIY
jgi:hypothetical protein